jgi:cyclopropane fatty-acyl-phospholipid synthase-like methyltransferase
MPQKEWFATWFDSPYYHLLYQHRDDNEAQQFLDHLIAKLALVSNAHVLDLACGKGRHSLTLAHKGFTVVGADLAANSIATAEQNRVALGLDNLNFVVHDMRKPLDGQQFDAIFNLFTSFGYFDTLQENQVVCKSIAQMLTSEGLLVIDFLNAYKVCKYLKPSEVVSRDGAQFNIERWHDHKHIFKQIEVIDTIQNTVVGTFTERVQALSLANFEALLSPYFEIQATYGSYALDTFNEQDSDRLIIIAKKRP